jgi:hypothetical protein
MATRDKTEGLTCPNCNGIVPVPEGVRVVQCPYCDMQSLVRGDRGVRRWQVARKVEREQALARVEGFFKGVNRARDLRKKAHIRETFLVYLPYWRVKALVVGWMLGRVKSGKDSTRPVEVRVNEEMVWNDAAADVAEFGVHRVPLEGKALQPYAEEELHLEGMIFEPSESPTDALAEAESHFLHNARGKRSLRSKFYEKVHALHPHLSLVYYPLWVARYEYRRRNYQVVVDGVSGKILYGKAPGNIFYRAAMLVLGMMFGNLLLVNGTILAFMLFAESSDDEGGFLICAPIVFGLALIFAGYRAFRYGEEVEERPKEAQKAKMAGEGGRSLTDMISISSLEEGMEALEDLANRR